MTELETKIRAALEHRAETTHVRAFEDEAGLPKSDTDVQQQLAANARFAGAPTRRRWLAAAAAAVVVAGGLVAVASLRQAPSPSPQSAPVDEPSRFAIDTDDPTAISLDEWIESSTPASTADQRFLVIDDSTLPTGVEITVAYSTTTSFGPLAEPGQPPSYMYRAVLGVDGLDVFDVVVDENRRAELAPPGLDCDSFDLDDTVDVNGTPAVTDGTSVCWTDADGVVIYVTPTATPGSPAAAPDPVTALSLANSIELTTVDELPRSEPTDGADEPGDAAFAGQLSGVSWAADVRAGPLRRMDVYVNGRKKSAFEHTRDSQPTDDELTSVRDATIAGVPGFGVIVYGTAPPTVEHVIVNQADGRRARLPVVPRELEANFAVPVPDYVVIDSIEFVDDTGAVVEVLHVPAIPPGLDGTFGEALTAGTDASSDS